MPRLIKNVVTAYIPGDPGNPGSPAVLAAPGYWSTDPVTVCGYITTYTTYCGGDDSLVSGYRPECVSLPRTVYDCVTTDELVYHPPTAASPGVPYAPPTPAQIIVSLNEGWNSYARTIGTLNAGAYINFTIKSGTKGALVAVAYPEFEGQPIAAFTHGLMIDASAIRVFESGVVVATLGVNQPGTEIRIARLSDGRIVYALDTGVFHISAAPAYHTALPLYVYGMLYAGYDEVSSAEFVTASLLAEPAAAFSATGSLSAQPVQYVEAYASGAGTLLGVSSTAATMSGAGTMLASIQQATLYGAGTLTGLLAAEQFIEATQTAASSLVGFAVTGGRGSASLPAIAAIGGDYAYGSGVGYLPYLASGATNGEQAYIPPQITRGYANLPFIVGFGHGVDVDHGDGSATLPFMASLGGDYPYGFGYGELPQIFSVGFGGFVPEDTMVLISPILATADVSQQIDIILTFTSSGQLESAHAVTRVQALEMLSTAMAEGTLDTLGIYGFSFSSSAHGLSVQSLSVGDSPDLNESGVVWVVNRETGASSQYEQYGFNSFFERGGSYYGVANDGIYLLGGGTDVNDPISALIETGRTNLGYTGEKKANAVYLGVGSEGELYLKVDVDEQQYVYAMRSHGTAVKDRAVEIGWGVRGDYWDFTLMNPGGVDFNIASIAFTPIPLARRG